MSLTGYCCQSGSEVFRLDLRPVKVVVHVLEAAAGALCRKINLEQRSSTYARPVLVGVLDCR